MRRKSTDVIRATSNSTCQSTSPFCIFFLAGIRPATSRIHQGNSATFIIKEACDKCQFFSGKSDLLNFALNHVAIFSVFPIEGNKPP